MSNLKKYLKVVNENVNNKRTFDRYMEVIHTNQDFFTRHEIDEFFRKEFKNDITLYDESIGEKLKSIVTGLLVTSFLAAAPMKGLSAKDSNFNDYLDSKVEQSIKQTKANAVKNQDDMDNVESLKNDNNPDIIKRAIANGSLKSSTIKDAFKDTPLSFQKKQKVALLELVNYVAKNTIGGMKKELIESQEKEIKDGFSEAIKERSQKLKNSNLQANALLLVNQSEDIRDFVKNYKAKIKMEPESDSNCHREMLMIFLKNYNLIKQSNLNNIDEKTFDTYIDNYLKNSQ
jgi:hypothetical protein